MRTSAPRPRPRAARGASRQVTSPRTTVTASDRANTARKATSGTGNSTAVDTRQMPMRPSIQPSWTATAAQAADRHPGGGPVAEPPRPRAPHTGEATATHAHTHATVPASAHRGDRPAPEAMFLVQPSTSCRRPAGYMRNPTASPPPRQVTGSPASR